MESNHKMILFALILGSFMMALDATIVSVALPSMATDLGEAGHDTKNISWVLLIYTLMLCCFVMLWSKIGTNKGYKKIFVLGIAIFTVSSLFIGICGMFSSVGLLPIIVLRAIQGIGAGMTIAMSLAMISAYLPAESRGSSIGAVTLASSAGTAFGPAIGGVLTTFHWSWIFFINIPIGIICLILCFKYMKVKEKLPENPGKLDAVGAILLFILLFSLVMYLNRGSDIGWTSNIGVSMLVVMAVSAGVLGWWENSKAKSPLLSLDILKHPIILRANIISLLMFMAMSGCYLLLPYFLQYVQGYETIEYGLILIANSLGMMVAGPIVGKLTDKTGNYKVFVVIGAAITVVGMFMLMNFQPDSLLWYILLSLFVMGAGIGMALVAVTSLSFSCIKDEDSGQLSGLNNTFKQAGSSMGVAILQAVFSAGIVVSGATIADKLMPGFHHAFFVGLIIILIALMIAITMKNSNKSAE